MERRHPFWRAQSLVVAPTGAGRGYAAEIKDAAGAPVATCDAEGTVRDVSGDELLTAPVRWHGRRDRGLNAGIEIAAGGRALGEGRVVKYGLGPRARKATIEISDAQGGATARLEPRDKRGEELAVTANGADLATVAVAVVKKGFLRKSRVYTVDLAEPMPEDLRPLVLAATIRYDALLDAVAAASMRD
jgi:hypothetical protein